ncbi:hypothetical protein ACNKHX_00765 [Shigella flexneri]
MKAENRGTAPEAQPIPLICAVLNADLTTAGVMGGAVQSLQEA